MSRKGLFMLALVAAGVALPACGEDGGGGDPGRDRDAPVDVRGVGLVRANSTAQFANCRDWRGGSMERRYATIEDIRGQLTPQSSESAVSDLSDEKAYRVFQRVCASEFSDELRLYKLYARAQAFARFTTDGG
ncbi:MAG TPA: hypothetical protein VFM57_14775 [Thermoleophilaceae bacterium]|nr:hypothetical protein [Thermoleophilaceae bacterium]